jgi:hypothetical protein
MPGMSDHEPEAILQTINLELQSWLSKSFMASVVLSDDKAKGQAFLAEAAAHRGNAVQAISDLVDAKLAARET